MSAVFSLICLVLALACYAISQLQQHGQLEWSKGHFRFWSDDSDKRKYKNYDEKQGPAFFLSTTVLVFITDGYHFMQFMFFNFIALGFTFAIGWSWWLLLALMVGIRLGHWALRETFRK